MFSINHREENCHHMLLFAEIEGDVGSEYNRGMYIYFFLYINTSVHFTGNPDRIGH